MRPHLSLDEILATASEENFYSLVWCPTNNFTKALKFIEDRISSGSPGKGSFVEVVLRDVLVDLLHQFAHAAKRAAPDGLLSDQSAPALDLVEPAGVGRRVMNVIAPMACQPRLDPRMFMGGVVVRDQMDLELRRNVVVEVIKKREKLLVAMTRLTLGDDRPVEHVERREPGGGAVAKVVVGHSFEVSQPHREHRLGALQRELSGISCVSS